MPTATKGEALVGPPRALAGVGRGFATLADLVALTLGPARGSVLSARGRGAPEVLNDSATMVRRVVELPGRDANVGAMLLRNLVWQVHERYGDGAATAAVLARAMLADAVRLVAAGVDPWGLRRGIERGVAAALPALAAQATPAGGQEALADFATGVTGDAELGAILGELFDLLGADAALLVEEYAAPRLDRAYLDGGRWLARPAARSLLPDDRPELVLDRPLLLVADQPLIAVEHVRGALELAATAPGKPPLLIVAPAISGDALDAILLNRAQATLALGAAVITSAAPRATDDLADLATLTGGEVVGETVGRSLRNLRPGWFGQARRAILTRDSLTVVGGGGDRRAVQERLVPLRARAASLPTASKDRERLRLRVARLGGGVGIVKVGAATAREREQKRALATKAVQVLGPAIAEGLVPGGGVALLDCRAAVLAARDDCASEAEAAGVAVVAAALAAPVRQLVRNHGRLDPAIALMDIERLGPGHGFDARPGGYALMAEAGVRDGLSVTRGVLEAAASAAGTAATIEVAVLPAEHRRELKLRP